MATQEQVNNEVAKLYAQMADYISRKVQGSDTFSDFLQINTLS